MDNFDSKGEWDEYCRETVVAVRVTLTVMYVNKSVIDITQRSAPGRLI